jgi:diguanylate cyclase (GGDEF)-like protein
VSDPFGRGAADKATILIVDDQPGNVRVLAKVLGDEYNIRFATTGQRALELAARDPIDLVLLDVTMPDMDGFEVCSRMKSHDHTRTTPVIFVTARGEVADEAHGFAVGGVDYITKPISPPIVQARVRTHLELKRSRDLLQQLAAIDGLTGLANRRRLDEQLEVEWQRAQRDGGWLSLALVDIDHFKALNDRYGHAQGDEVLRMLADTLRDVARRPTDLAARYGGEEFALVLPSTGPAGARRCVVALMGGVRRLAIEHMDSPTSPHITVSVGTVSLKPEQHASLADAVQTTDECLYEAKRTGRNRSVCLDLEAGHKRVLAPSLREGARSVDEIDRGQIG